jgi:MoxR-like ATPase
MTAPKQAPETTKRSLVWPAEVMTAIKRLDEVKRTLKELFVERDLAIDLMALAAVCQEHLLLLGPPGTAKTELVNRFSDLIQARRFHYLLTRFTEPTEVFGPLDLEKFQKGMFQIRTDGMLPEAEVAFLDEVFQGSSAILNGFVTLVHERVFYNGSVRQPVPLLCLIGASNELPDEPVLRAFADRFILRVQVDPVSTDRLGDLLDVGWSRLELDRIQATQGKAGQVLAPLTVPQLKALYGRLESVKVDAIQPVYADILKELRSEGLNLSDRRAVKGLKLVAAAALLRGSDKAEPQDFWPLNHIWSRPEEAASLANVIQPRVAEAGGPAMSLARPASEILEDLEVLEGQLSGLRRETQVVAHLGRYNELRREAGRNHRDNTELKTRITAAIDRLMGLLTTLQQEAGHV